MNDDDLLSAYIDGELPPDDRQALDLRLTRELGLARRLDGLRAADAAFAARFATVLAEPVPLALARAIARNPAAGGAARGALWAAAGVLAGVAATWAALTFTPLAPQSRDWTDEIAAYHRIYSSEDRHLVEVGADEADHIRKWLGGRIGRDFQIPDLADYGLTFAGARLLAADGAPVAQLVYTLPTGEVFALCLTPRPGSADAAMRTEDYGDLDAVVWRDAGTAMVMIGPAGRLPLLDVSEAAGRLL